MYFRSHRRNRWLSFFSYFCIGIGISFSLQAQQTLTYTQQEDVILATKPSSCVSLHQGRICYARILVNWQVSKRGNYCLVNQTSKKQLKCWRQATQQQFAYEFESKESMTFQLVDADNNQVVANTEIKVGWVHKSTPRKRRWRLF